MNREHAIRTHWTLALALLLGLGLALALTTLASAHAGAQPNAAPNATGNPLSGDKCFATPNDGTSEYSSTDASAVQDAVDARVEH